MGRTKQVAAKSKRPPAGAAAANASPPKAKKPSKMQKLADETSELTAQLHKLQTQIDTQRRLDANAVEFEAKRLLQQQRLQLDASAAASSPAAASSASVSSSPSPAPLSSAVVLPSHWPSQQSHHVQLKTLVADDADFRMAANMLASSGLPTAVMLSVQRIYNLPLWERYVQARERVMTKIGNESLNTAESMGNEQLLFHGTRQNAPHLIYSNADGFDVRMAGHGMLGPGMYFSRSSQYSGRSYAHGLTGHSPMSYGSHSSSGYQPSKPTIPPLFSVTPAGKLKVEKLPPQTFQMLIARVCLGTEYDAKNGQPQGGYFGGRPPVRPFHCPQCKTKVDLEKINLDTLRSSLGDGRAIGEECGEEEERQENNEELLGETSPAKGGRKRKRSAASAATPAASAPASASASASAAAVPAAPIVSIVPLRKSSRRGSKASPAAAVTTSAAPAVAPAPASVSLAQLPAVAAVAVAQSGPVAASTPAAVSVSVSPVPIPVAESEAAPAKDTAASASDAAASASDAESAAVMPPASSVATFESFAVHCSKASCRARLGTRKELLSTPQRYDSVINDHMSVVYASELAYPEFLITYQLKQ
jgi:hypothetical protein